MTPQEALRVARSRGITIEVAGDKLRIAPAASVDPALRDALATHKAVLLRLLARPRLDAAGRPLDQCPLCGCPTWWQTLEAEWYCDHCHPRPEPFSGLSLVTAGGEWLIH
jgi:hypothetical protein